MALNLYLQNSQYGVPFPEAYFRITTVAVTRHRNPEIKFSVMIDVAGYASRTPTDDTRELELRRYYAPLADVETQFGTEFLAKCYNWVANQPDMAGSTPI